MKAEGTRPDTQKESLDVLLIGYNEEENLPLCIQSAQRACRLVSDQLGMESRIVYVDGKSTDRSREIARDSGIEVFVEHPDFHSCGNGCASGFALTNASYVMFLDADCMLYEEWLVEGLRFLKSHKDVAGVVGIVNTTRKVGNRVIQIEDKTSLTEPTEVPPDFPGSGPFLVKRTATAEIGAHEPELVTNDDTFFAVEIRAKGWQIYKLPIPMVLHNDRHLSSTTSGLLKFMTSVRGALIRGALLRHSLDRGLARFILPHFKWEFIHGVFMLFLAILAALLIGIPQYRLEIGIFALIASGSYLLVQIARKQSLVFGLTAIPLLTAFAICIPLGFFFKYPGMRWGAQRTEEYRKRVRAVNSGAAIIDK